MESQNANRLLLDAAPAASSSPGVALGAADGVTAVAASEATDVTTEVLPATVDGTADDTRASVSAYTTGMDIGAVAAPPPPPCRTQAEGSR